MSASLFPSRFTYTKNSALNTTWSYITIELTWSVHVRWYPEGTALTATVTHWLYLPRARTQLRTNLTSTRYGYTENCVEFATDTAARSLADGRVPRMRSCLSQRCTILKQHFLLTLSPTRSLALICFSSESVYLHLKYDWRVQYTTTLQI